MTPSCLHVPQIRLIGYEDVGGPEYIFVVGAALQDRTLDVVELQPVGRCVSGLYILPCISGHVHTECVYEGPSGPLVGLNRAIS